MAYDGGLRERLIHDNVHDHIQRALDALGWFEAGRRHQPVTLTTRPIDDREDIALNTIALSSGDIDGLPLELGSSQEEESTTFYVDIYAEDDAIGMHLSGDIRAFMKGQMPSIDYTRPAVPVYDLTLDPVPVDPEFWCPVEDVVRDRAQTYTQLWQKHWYIVRFQIVDDHL